MIYIKRIRIEHDKIPIASYLNKIPIIANTNEILLQSPITILTGENGSGKSTLLEAIAVAYGFNPEGGTCNFNFHTQDTHSFLSQAIKIDKGIYRPQDNFFLRAESFYNVASQIDEYEDDDHGYLNYYGGKSLHEQSHGESFMSLIQNRFSGNGLYILDEPEAALSPQRQLALLLMITELAKNNSQFIIVTHSPILLGIPEAELLSLDNHQITKINYEDAPSYQIMKLFINQREKILSELLKKDD